MPWFPTCSACLPPSQAPLCHCTHRTVTDRPEGTFGSLRYAFGGDHPSQTTRQAVSPHPGVRDQTTEGPYFNWRLRQGWRPAFSASGLSYTSGAQTQREAAVKVHGVFPSRRG